MRISFSPMTSDVIRVPGTNLPAYTLIFILASMVYVPLLPYALFFMALTWWLAFKGRSYLWVYRRIKSKIHLGRVSSRPIWYIRRFSYFYSPEEY